MSTLKAVIHFIVEVILFAGLRRIMFALFGGILLSVMPAGAVPWVIFAVLIYFTVFNKKVARLYNLVRDASVAKIFKLINYVSSKFGSGHQYA